MDSNQPLDSLPVTKGHVTVVFGGNAGSESKGKIAGYLAIRDNIEMAVSNFQPNAGHVWVSPEGESVMVQTLPQALVNPTTDLFLSAGSAIDIELLKREVEEYSVSEDRVCIHPRAAIINKRHKEAEADANGSNMNRVSSTLKGCGAAAAEKVTRNPNLYLAQHYKELGLLGFFVDTVCRNSEFFSQEILSRFSKGESLLLECAQGFDLDINHGVSWPYCTSRQTTPAQALADAGLPPQILSGADIIAVIRPYPIRVGDAFDKETGEKLGTSGDYPSDEISWEEVANRSGTPREEIAELATVTKKLRRVFEPNFKRLKHMVSVTGATQLALNFANYIDYSVKGVSDPNQLTQKVWEFVEQLEAATGIPVVLIGTGPCDHEIVDLSLHPEFVRPRTLTDYVQESMEENSSLASPATSPDTYSTVAVDDSELQIR